MRRLLVLRHAKTENDSPTGRDRDRRINDRGRADALDIANYLVHEQLTPEQIVVSSAVRTRQTLDIIQGEMSPPPDVTIDEALYHAGVSELFEIVRALGGTTNPLMLIGHNPGLHEFALALVAEGHQAGRRALEAGLPTSGLVVIDCLIDDWSDLMFRCGRLDRFISPRLLREATP